MDKKNKYFIEALNTQGYIFQEKCSTLLKEARKKGDIDWSVYVEEYPTSFYGQDTRVDLILEKGYYDTHKKNGRFLIVECKKPDPRYSSWVFTQCREINENLKAIQVEIRSITSGEENLPVVKSYEYDLYNFLKDSYFASYGIEVSYDYKAEKNNVDKNRKQTKTETIYNACSQVFKGQNGFVFEEITKKITHAELCDFVYLPAIFTTAKLFAALYDIKDVDIISGRINKAEVVEVPWIILDWGLTHPLEFEMEDYNKETKSVFRYDSQELHEKIKRKPIFIVNSEHIIHFLQKLKFQ